MLKRLPSDVATFLRENPKELQTVRFRMQDLENERTRPRREQAERDRRAALPLSKCPGLLGPSSCDNMTPGGFVCDDCNAEFSSDPDAYK